MNNQNQGTENVPQDETKKDTNVINQFHAIQVNDRELLSLEKKERSIALEVKMFDLEQRRAVALSKSAFFPEALRGDVASAVIVNDLSKRMDVSEMEIAQSIYIIYGKPSFSTTFLVARLNTSGLIAGTLETVMNEEKNSCYCTAIDAASGKEIKGVTITLEMAKAEGWSTKSGSKWKTMPELMLEKRAQAFFIRGKYPQVMFGSQTKEELEDVHADVIDAEFSTSPEKEIKENNSSVQVDIPAIDKPVETKEKETSTQESQQQGMFNTENTTTDNEGNVMDGNGEVIHDASDIPSVKKEEW